MGLFLSAPHAGRCVASVASVVHRLTSACWEDSLRAKKKLAHGAGDAVHVWGGPVSRGRKGQAEEGLGKPR